LLLLDPETFLFHHILRKNASNWQMTCRIFEIYRYFYLRGHVHTAFMIEAFVSRVHMVIRFSNL